MHVLDYSVFRQDFYLSFYDTYNVNTFNTKARDIQINIYCSALKTY